MVGTSWLLESRAGWSTETDDPDKAVSVPSVDHPLSRSVGTPSVVTVSAARA